MRGCIINDCTGFKTLAPCCLDCPERQRCPDVCPVKEVTFCVGVIDYDGKRVSETAETTGD